MIFNVWSTWPWTSWNSSVKDNLSKRGNPDYIEMLDKLIDLDKKWRLNLTELNKLRHKRKLATNKIAYLKKIKRDLSKSIEKAKKIDGLIENLEKEVAVEKKEIESKKAQFLKTRKGTYTNIRSQVWLRSLLSSFQKNHVESHPCIFLWLEMFCGLI